MACYHIFWSENYFDCACHKTIDEAKTSAEQLVRSGESYTIEKCAHEQLQPPQREEEDWLAES
jgi:hypothetical protein